MAWRRGGLAEVAHLAGNTLGDLRVTTGDFKILGSWQTFKTESSLNLIIKTSLACDLGNSVSKSQNDRVHMYSSEKTAHHKGQMDMGWKTGKISFSIPFPLLSTFFLKKSY